jgi:AhpD family alkylhydroperoxidase
MRHAEQPSPALVELVYLRISQINNCAYCLDMHMRDLLKRGKIEKLALVQAWAEAGNLFDERERAATLREVPAWLECGLARAAVHRGLNIPQIPRDGNLHCRQQAAHPGMPLIRVRDNSCLQMSAISSLSMTTLRCGTW